MQRLRYLNSAADERYKRYFQIIFSVPLKILEMNFQLGNSRQSTVSVYHYHVIFLFSYNYHKYSLFILIHKRWCYPTISSVWNKIRFIVWIVWISSATALKRPPYKISSRTLYRSWCICFFLQITFILEQIFTSTSIDC